MDSFLVHKSGFHMFSRNAFAFGSWRDSALLHIQGRLEAKFNCALVFERGLIFNGFFAVRRIEWFSR
jgi:hypothetical protein